VGTNIPPLLSPPSHLSSSLVPLQVYSAASELVQDNCVVRGKEFDPFADDNDPKDRELKEELLGVQREVSSNACPNDQREVWLVALRVVGHHHGQ
jgi:hypothetical protein